MVVNGEAGFELRAIRLPKHVVFPSFHAALATIKHENYCRNLKKLNC